MIRKNNNQKPVGEIEELSEEALSEVTGGRDPGIRRPISPPRINRDQLPPPPPPPVIATHGDVTAHRVGDQVVLNRPGGGTNNLHIDVYNHLVNTGNIHLMLPR
jgi:hypothetical protein